METCLSSKHDFCAQDFGSFISERSEKGLELFPLQLCFLHGFGRFCSRGAQLQLIFVVVAAGEKN